MCECHGYRHAHQKLLYFSVQERHLKQDEKHDGIIKLLKTVLDEAKEEYETRLEKTKREEMRQRKRTQKLAAYDLKEPPTKVVTHPESRRLVSGNPLHDQYHSYSSILEAHGVFDDSDSLNTQYTAGLSASFGSLPSAMEHQSHLSAAALGGILFEAIAPDFLQPPQYEITPAKYEPSQYAFEAITPDSLQPPQYEILPAKYEPSQYALLDRELKQKLEHYPKVVWQKIETERRFIDEDDEIKRQVRVARQATKRALAALVKDGEVAVEGKRADAVYYLVIEPS